MFKYAGILISSLIIFASCKNEAKTLFTSLDKNATNVNFQNTFFDDGPLNVANYIYFYNGGGVAIGDINNDGLPDILFTGNMVRNRLFLNKGDFQFEDITARSRIAEKQGWCTGATMVDINNDGRLDFLALQTDGAILRISDRQQGTDWDIAEIARWPHPPGDLPPSAVHNFALTILGIHLLDRADFDKLGETAAARNRWEFMLTIAPLPIPRGTGSPVNPIAMF